MNMTLKRMQRGFTLLELVIVIVIIGILAAIAVPKFVSLSADARLGAMKGVQGALAGANVAIYSAAQTQNQSGAKGTGVIACGANNITTVWGYATDLAQLANCVTLTPVGDFSTLTGTTVHHKGASVAASCEITYVPAQSATVPPTYNFTATVPDCS